jgi:copper chaperone CopZ
MNQAVTLQVEGMDCSACEQRLQRMLGRWDAAVSAVEADHATGQVRVRFDPSRADAGTLAGAAAERIEQAGFTVTGCRQDEEGGRP